MCTKKSGLNALGHRARDTLSNDWRNVPAHFKRPSLYAEHAGAVATEPQYEIIMRYFPQSIWSEILVYNTLFTVALKVTRDCTLAIQRD